MSTLRKSLALTLAAGAAVAGSLLGAGTASAGAWNDWGSGSYHAGYDGVAGSGSFTLKGRACGGGDARYFYVQLVRTRDSAKISSTYSYPADNQVYSQGGSGISSGTAYYTRWYGQNNNLSNGYSAPCAGGGFDS
ncbi:hypothetical protein [Streptomyces sp. PvR034]|uniref:hypothetical protein n=1 Tax=Streptomyces sp. PvR034 TaxID=3156401 RepID=UPI00339305C0